MTELVTPRFSGDVIVGKGGPRGTQLKKLQNLDPIKLEGRFVGIKFAYITGVHYFNYFRFSQQLLLIINQTAVL